MGSPSAGGACVPPGRPSPARSARSFRASPTGSRAAGADPGDRSFRHSRPTLAILSIEQRTTSEATSDWIPGTPTSPEALRRAANDEAPDCWPGAVRWLNAASWLARSCLIAWSSSVWLITCHSPRRTTVAKNPHELRDPRRNACDAPAKNRKRSAGVRVTKPDDAASSNSASKAAPFDQQSLRITEPGAELARGDLGTAVAIRVADDDRFVVVQNESRDEVKPGIVVVENWFTEYKDRP